MAEWVGGVEVGIARCELGSASSMSDESSDVIEEWITSSFVLVGAEAATPLLCVIKLVKRSGESCREVAPAYPAHHHILNNFVV